VGRGEGLGGQTLRWGKHSSRLPSCPWIFDQAATNGLQPRHEPRVTRARGQEPPLCVISFAPLPPRCLHRRALRGGRHGLIKAQVRISRAHQGPRWLLWINSSALLFQLHKFSRRRDTFTEFHFAC